MIDVKTIEYGTGDYMATLELRNRVMRVPLGLSIYKEDTSFEQHARMVAAFDEETVVGVGVMTAQGGVFKLEFLCVDTTLQGRGIGGMMLARLEEKARAEGGTRLFMDARVSASAFYRRHGYREVGEVFSLDYAPVPHIVMEKEL